MEKCTNQVSPEVASNRLSKLLAESTNIAIAPFLLDLVQIHLSLAAAQIFFHSKIYSFLPFFLLCPCFVLYGHSTASRPYIRVHVTVLSHEPGMFALPASPWLPSFLFVVLALFHYLRLLPCALSPPRANLPIFRCALLCSTLSVAVKSKLPLAPHQTVGHSTDIIVTVSDDCRTWKPEDGSSK
jgi:hypothetical protein